MNSASFNADRQAYRSCENFIHNICSSRCYSELKMLVYLKLMLPSCDVISIFNV